MSFPENNKGKKQVIDLSDYFERAKQKQEKQVSATSRGGSGANISQRRTWFVVIGSVMLVIVLLMLAVSAGIQRNVNNEIRWEAPPAE